MPQIPGPPPGALGAISVELPGTGPAIAGTVRVDIQSGATTGFLGGVDPVFHENAGVYGQSTQSGVFGNSDAGGGTGIHGRGGGAQGFGVRGEISGAGAAAVQGQVFGAGAGLAGRFIGDVRVTGNVNVGGDLVLVDPNGRDVAEHFAADATIACRPGMVMALNDEGLLLPCAKAYDKRVVGVVSGAGSLRPAITLGMNSDGAGGASIALIGTAYCFVDADFGAIEPGDLLTSSPTEGHAMRADETGKTFGTIIGKALQTLRSGRGLIAVLVSIQ